jgi:hypothetical protein
MIFERWSIDLQRSDPFAKDVVKQWRYIFVSVAEYAIVCRQLQTRVRVWMIDGQSCLHERKNKVGD